MTTIKVKNYPNATSFKLKNRRVDVVTLEENGDYQIEMKIMTTKEKANTPRAGHKNIKDKIALTGIRISTEAAVALYFGLQNELAKNGIEISEEYTFTH